MVKLIPKYGIICDDVREENNGKSIIIGIYTGDILVKKFPCVLNLSVWLGVNIEIEEDLDFFRIECRIQVDFNNNDSVKVKPLTARTHIDIRDITFTAASNGKDTIVVEQGINRAVLEIPTKGVLTVSVREPKKRWRKLISKEIKEQSG